MVVLQDAIPVAEALELDELVGGEAVTPSAVEICSPWLAPSRADMNWSVTSS